MVNGQRYELNSKVSCISNTMVHFLGTESLDLAFSCHKKIDYRTT